MTVKQFRGIKKQNNFRSVKMSMTGDSEAVLNQIRDIQSRDIAPEEKSSLINKLLGNK